MPSDKRPIVGVARMRDVARRGDTYLVHLVLPPFEMPPIEFILKCPRPSLSGEASDPFFFSESLRSLTYPEYAFVARIHRIIRSDSAVVEVEREGATVDRRPRWLAEGECLALREIPREKSEGGGAGTTQGRARPRPGQ